MAAFATEAYTRTLKRGYGIAGVDYIGWAPPLDHLSPNPELAALIPGFQPIFASDDFLVQLRAAEAGIGAIFLGRARHRFSPPTPLRELPLDFGDLRRTVYLVAARSALAIPRVRAVADLLAAEIQRTEAPRKKRR